MLARLYERNDVLIVSIAFPFQINLRVSVVGHVHFEMQNTITNCRNIERIA